MNIRMAMAGSLLLSLQLQISHGTNGIQVFCACRWDRIPVDAWENCASSASSMNLYYGNSHSILIAHAAMSVQPPFEIMQSVKPRQRASSSYLSWWHDRTWMILVYRGPISFPFRICGLCTHRIRLLHEHRFSANVLWISWRKTMRDDRSVYGSVHNQFFPCR